MTEGFLYITQRTVPCVIVDTNSPLGFNVFAYCSNNPIMRIDPTGHAWWHWALGAAIVGICEVATVVTAGGFAAGIGAVLMVGNGIAAATTASTIAAGALIGSATVYGTSALSAAFISNSVKDFNNQGNWWTVASTVGGAIFGGINGYGLATGINSNTNSGRGTQNPKVKSAAERGRQMHAQYDYGAGVVKEKTISPGCRVDGFDETNHIIYELKPNNPAAIARGNAQLNRYIVAAEASYGGK